MAVLGWEHRHIFDRQERELLLELFCAAVSRSAGNYFGRKITISSSVPDWTFKGWWGVSKRSFNGSPEEVWLRWPLAGIRGVWHTKPGDANHATIRNCLTVFSSHQLSG